MRLTKDVRKQLLEQNEGFSTRTSYSGKNFSEARTYTITGGELRVRASGDTSWADSRYTRDYVADEEQTHRYLYDNLGLLDQDNDFVGRAARQKRPSEPVASVDGLAEDDAYDGDDSDSIGEQFDDATSGLSDRLVVIGALVLAAGGLAYVFGRPVWDDRVKPAIERRRTKREQRKTAAVSDREGTKTRDGVPEDKG